MKRKKPNNLSAYKRWQDERHKHRCAKCNGNYQLSVDHIIPLSLIESMAGTRDDVYEWEENFQYLCLMCNRMKSSNLDHTNQKTVPLLRKVVENYVSRMYTPPPSQSPRLTSQ